MRIPRILRTALAVLALLPLTSPLAGQEKKTDEGPSAEAKASAEVVVEKAKRSVIEFRPKGAYLDLPELGVGLEQLLMGGSPKPKPFFTLCERLARLPKDHAGAELLLDLTAPHSFNMVQIAELHRRFDALRAAGIRSTAFLENGELGDLLLASACDRILMADVGLLAPLAPSMQVLHLKDAMDLFGIQMQVTRSGRFKGAVEPYMLSRMSGHLRAHYETMLGTVNDRIVSMIAERRGLSAEKVRRAQGLGLLRAPEALEHGLIDGVVAWRGARAALGHSEADVTYTKLEKAKKKKGFNLFKLLSSSGKGKKESRLSDEAIVVLHLSGAIVDGQNRAPGQIVSGPVVKQVQKLREDPKVKAVLVRVNSPGGSGSASEAIVLALRDLARVKPVAVSMGTYAASGGYYVSMIGCPIWAEHATITGSIGVFGTRPNFERLAARIGVRNERVALDPVSALNDPFVALDEAHLGRIQNFVDHFYERFLQRVLEVRDLERAELLELAGGRVWSGVQAKENGLVDHLGGTEEALAYLRGKLGEGAEKMKVLHRPEIEDNPFAILEQMFGAQAETRATLRLLAARGYDIDGLLAILEQGWRHPQRPLILARMPFDLRLR
jgi:protease-4